MVIMDIVRGVIFLVLTGTCALSQSVRQQPPKISSQPETMIRNLYSQVEARHPVGIPKGTDLKDLAPYLTQTLLHRFDLANACAADWHRQNPGFSLKPEYGWLELGPFSGDDEKATPSAFVIEKKQAERDGSTHVHIKLTYNEPGASMWTWHVVAIVLRENDDYKVDDIIYLKEQGQSTEARLSTRLSAGCNGPHWVGFGDRKQDLKKDE